MDHGVKLKPFLLLIYTNYIILFVYIYNIYIILFVSCLFFETESYYISLVAWNLIYRPEWP